MHKATYQPTLKAAMGHQQGRTITAATKAILLTATMLFTAMGLSACGSEHEEVKAVDKVAEAAELAKANAPKAEVIEFAPSEQAVMAETTSADAVTESTAADSSNAEAEPPVEQAAATSTAVTMPETTADTAEATAAETTTTE